MTKIKEKSYTGSFGIGRPWPYYPRTKSGAPDMRFKINKVNSPLTTPYRNIIFRTDAMPDFDKKIIYRIFKGEKV